MTDTLDGGCHCGAVRYKGQRADFSPFRCYCRDCQQLTGTGHSEMLPLDAASFEVRGTIREYAMTARSGRTTWAGFCPECGAQLTRRAQASPDRIYVHAASLTDPAHYSPALSIYTDSAQPWDPPAKD